MAELPSKSFHYPEHNGQEQHRMCATGQRRAAAEGNDLLTPGITIGQEQILRRAVIAELALKRGADVNKHNLISYVVMEAFCAGELSTLTDMDGNFLLETFTGNTFPTNIFVEIEQGKDIF